jgi:hypothetical protein
MRRTPAFIIRNLCIVAVLASCIKAELSLSAPVNCNSQQIPVTVELVLDHAPEYSIPAFLSAQSNDVSSTPDCAIAYRNARACHAQIVRVLLMVCGTPSYSAVPFLFHRSLPGKSLDDDLIEIS